MSSTGPSDREPANVRELVQLAMALGPAERGAFLTRVCEGDPGLYEQLAHMLAAAGDSRFVPAPKERSAASEGETIAPTGWSRTAGGSEGPANPTRGDEVTLAGTGTAGEHSTGANRDDFADDSRWEGPGSHIGVYKLLQNIGEGGFGTVFMAEQERPVQRRVALKIIKLGMDTRTVVARFEQERQALAMMDHPNIAKVLDAGATDTGRPYFVMELCKGEPIAEYCDKHNLSIPERLELFAQVCQAVQHAHGKGIIHRDLKPSNVLVSTQDGRAHAKVIDFGIAKATASKLTEKTLFTEHKALVGTPEYMSPEQAEGSLDIDTRTDVYSLGVILYELLTGTTPFTGKELRSGAYAEIQRIIREVEPATPSTRLSANTESLAKVAANRRTEPRKLGVLIRGDLDWIVMKALEKDRSRRYETAQGLAMDIRRFLGGEPVLAAPPGAGYRINKFVRRHRVTVTAGAAVSASLLIGAVGFALKAREAGLERDAAIIARQAEAAERAKADGLARSEAVQRAAAESEQRKAAAINQFLLDMLRSADLNRKGRDARVADTLDTAAATVGTSFAERPEVEAAVRQILGRTYLSLGLLDQAEPQITRAMELSRTLHGEHSVEYARTLSHRAHATQLRGRHDEAVEDYRAALALMRELGGDADELVIGSQSDLANSLVLAGQAKEAEELFRKTLEVQRTLTGRDPRERLVLLNSLAVLLHNDKRLTEAESLYREAVELGSKELGGEHPDTLTARTNLGSILLSRGKPKDAEPILTETYAATKRVFGELHPKSGGAAHSLADLYSTMGRFKDALPLFEEAFAARKRNEGENTAGAMNAKAAVALTLQRMADFDRAIPMLREILATRKALLGAEDFQVIGTELDLANALSAAGKAADAEPMFQYLLELCPRVLGEDHPRTIVATNSYAVMLMGQNRYAEAEPFVRRALEVGRRVEGPDARNTVITQANLGAVLRETGKLQEAEKLTADTIQRFTKVFGPAHPNTAAALGSHGEVLMKLGRNDDAADDIKDAIEIAVKALGGDHVTVAGYRAMLGRVYLQDSKPEPAEEQLRQATAALTRPGGANDRRLASAQVDLGRALTMLGRFDEAETTLLAAEKVLAESSKAPVARRTACLQAILALYAAWDKAEPGKGIAARAAAWSPKLEAIVPSETPGPER